MMITAHGRRREPAMALDKDSDSVLELAAEIMLGGGSGVATWTDGKLTSTAQQLRSALGDIDPNQKRIVAKAIKKIEDEIYKRAGDPRLNR